MKGFGHCSLDGVLVGIEGPIQIRFHFPPVKSLRTFGSARPVCQAAAVVASLWIIARAASRRALVRRSQPVPRIGELAKAL
jgi:hypothetical protein